MKNILILLLLAIISFGCIQSGENRDSFKKRDAPFSPKDTLSAHYLHELKYGKLNASSEKHWDRINNTIHTSGHRGEYERDPNYRTFGWHLYSRGSTYRDYNFSLLWGVAYFAYIVDPENGSYKNIHQWKTTALIDSAKAYNCNTFLTVANFGKENNERFLNNPNAQSTLIDSVIHLLSLRGANGINIDFESIPTDNKTQFSAFVRKISQRIKQADPEYMVSICLYAVDYNHIFEITAIDPYIDFYTLMGYDYYGGFSTNAGPVAPLRKSHNFGENCLESSVGNYIEKGIKPSKLIVGLPYYGAEWTVTDTTFASKAEKFNDHLSYSTIQEKYSDLSLGRGLFDSIVSSGYRNMPDNGNHFTQLWFDDSSSLSIKYDWIKRKKLGGVGIWALGFDNGHPELWNLLSEKFGK